jgi:glycogen synthase
MRVLYFVECFWPYVGGVEVISAKVLPRLAARGIEISVVTFSDTRGLPEHERYEGLDVHRAGWRRAVWDRDVVEIAATKQRVSSLKREIAPDLVHAVVTGPASFLFHVTTMDAVTAPTLLSFHGPHGDGADESSLVQRAIAGATWVTGCSESVTRHVTALAPAAAARCSLLPNGLEPPGFEPAPLRLDPPVLLCASRLSPEKGIDVALDALVLVRREYPAARLVVAGGGAEKDNLLAHADALGLAGAVDFQGWSAPHAVASLIDRASIVLMPSRSEGFGLTALQGMLGGRPVVASRVDGLPEVLGDDGGLLVAPGDPQALAQAIVRLLHDPGLAEAVAAAGRDRARDRFPFDRCVDAYEALYRQLATPARAS